MGKVYKFSEFILDKNSITLYRDNIPIQLSSRAFDLLAYLIENRGKVVEKEDILGKIWKDSFVEEANLPVHVSALRRVLNEKKGESRFIRTISGRGYSFIANVEELDSSQNLIKIKTKASNENKVISIAILPFSIERSSADIEYLANGITQSLIGDLSNIQDIRVLAYNAVKSYKNSELELQEIGFLLDAEKLLIGVISEYEGKWEISAELINAGDKSCIWATTESFQADDLFEVKKKISSAIVEKLKLKLITKSNDRKEIKSEAQKLYYRGKFILESRGTKKQPQEILNQALKFFKEAVFCDPTYALAHVGIGSVHVSLYNHNLIERKIALSEAKKALQIALNIDEHLFEAYILKGSIQLIFEKDFLNSEKMFNLAIEINPNNPDGYHWKSIVNLCLGNFSQALSLEEKAVKLDPTSSRYNQTLIRIFYFSGNYEKALIQAEELIEFDQKFLASFLFIALTHTQLGNFDLALKNIEEALKIRKTPEILLNKAYIHGAFGDRRRAIQILEETLRNYPSKEIDNVDIAIVYSSIDEPENALKYLDKAYEEKSAGLLTLFIDNRYKSLRKNKRYQNLLQKLNFV